MLLSLFALLSVPVPSDLAEPASRTGAATSIHWIDLNADGLQDALAVDGAGGLKLLRNDGGVVFVDETLEAGLGEVAGVIRVLPGDWEGDGDTDLVLARSAELSLAVNELGVFQVRPAMAVPEALPATELGWVDADGDERPDLHVTTPAEHVVLRNRVAGFERIELGVEGSATNRAAARVTGSPTEHVVEHRTTLVDADGPTEGDGDDSGNELVTPSSGGSVLDPMGTDTSTDLLCATSVRDQVTGSCMSVSSEPVLGMLYPVSTELFIEAGTGRVGIGTTTPGYALEVAGQIVSGVNNTPTGVNSAIGGGLNNSASGEGATIAGGESNTATGPQATVGGGLFNIANSEQSAVLGGVGNRAGYRGFVGGGNNNRALGNLSVAAGGNLNEALGGRDTVGGGDGNLANAGQATIAGGQSNTATGAYGAIPGGRENSAAGAYSMAAGRRAKANHDGAFVWGDSTDADVTSTAPNQFVVRASGGMGVGKTPDPSFQLDVEGAVRSSDTIVSTKAVGAPFAVASSDVVANLNADHLDGFDAASFSMFGSEVDTGELADEAVTNAKVAAGASIAGTKIDPDFGSQDVTTSGDVGVGITPEFPVHVSGGTEVEVTGGGSLVLEEEAFGIESSLAFDTDELQARTFTDFFGPDYSPAPLRLNPAGGTLWMGNATSTVNVPGNLSTGTFEMSTGAAEGSVLTSDASGNGTWSPTPDASWTPITSLPYTISSPGAYYVAGDLTGVSGFSGIDVTADDVLLDLNGHALTGVPGAFVGVNASAASRFTLRGGRINDWLLGGVSLGPHAIVSGLTTSNNFSGGLIGGSAAEQVWISNYYSVADSTYGVYIDSGVIEDSVVVGSDIGFFIDSTGKGSLVRGCVARQCNYGFVFLYGRMVDCVATDSTTYGIQLFSAAAVGCYARNSGTRGFSVAGGSRVQGCLAVGGGTGFGVGGDGSRLDGNSSNGCNVGFEVTGTDNLLIRNSDEGSTTAFSIGAGNQDAAVLSPGSGFSTSNAWANISH